MNRITFPLAPQVRGADVGNLQAALQLLLDRVAILRDDERLRLALADGLRKERDAALYGDVTERLVGVFQDERGVSVGGARGAVDEATAAALNSQLHDWGLLDGDSADGRRPYVITGTVRRDDGLALEGVRVRALQEAGRAVRLGEDVTDAEGGYTIRYHLLSDVGRPRVRVSTAAENGTAPVSSGVMDDPGPLEVVDLTLPVTEEGAARQRLEGRVLYEDGRLAEQLRLRLYRREFGGGSTLLAEGGTLTGGRYAFAFDAAAAPGPLDLRAVSAAGEETALAEPFDHLNGDATMTLNVVAPAALVPLGSEYERLAADLAPLAGELPKLAMARETTDQPDLTLLNRKTGWDARLISLAAASQRLSADQDVGLSAQVLYGLLRAGLPSDKLLLAEVGADGAQRALTAVQEAGIVALSDTELRRFKAAFEAFASKVQLGVPAPGSQATYGELLATSGLSDDAQAAFAAAYLGDRGGVGELWERAEAAGLNGTQIAQLKLHGKLAYLTGNSAMMTGRLRQSLDGAGAARLAEKGLYAATAWIDEIDAAAGIPAQRRDALTAGDAGKLDALIPSRFVGDRAESRRDLWAEDMARKVRMSYPTHVVADMVEKDTTGDFGLSADRTATASLLRSCATQGFRLGETPIEPFLAAHTGVRASLAASDFETARQEMKTLQRVYQITPTNEAMTALLKLGLTSAFDVVALPEAAFVDRYQAKLGGTEITRLVHRKATQVSSITYNLFAIGKKLDSGATVQAIAGTPAQHAAAKGALKESLKQYPTMESLFGSMDSCECEHCSSVLSPAAYFVDLLQFLDVEPTVWAGFLARWKETHDNQPYPNPSPYEVLAARRPDLPHQSLTCDNVETALPYIDVVNEILEYYVANRGLTADAVRNTGGASSAELLAEPANVIEKAYDVLGAARYPLPLPFDLPLETVRRFCDYFDRPLAGVLEVFRGGDTLFAPAQDYDRAAIFAESLGISPAEWAIFTDPAPLASERWYDLYGLWRSRPAISNPTNAGNATVTIADANAAPLNAGDPCRYFDVSANALRAETRLIAEVGSPGSGGAGQAKITFAGVWTTPPEANDLLVFDAPTALKSAKTLAGRLGVTYKQLVDIVSTGFVNPRLDALVLLHKLGVGIHNVVFCRAPENVTLYAQNKDLLDQERSDLPPGDQARFDALTQAQWQALHEVQAFERQLSEVTTRYRITPAQVEAALQAVPMDEILVLADPDAGCDFDLTTLRYASGRAADDIAFLRINLLVRIWRKLGWSLDETDRALQAFVPQSAPVDEADLGKQPLSTALIYIAHLDALHDRGNISRIKLLALWSDIATSGAKSPYASLFLTPAVLRSDDVFDHPFGPYLSAADLAARAQTETYSVLLRDVAPADRIDPAPFAGEPRIMFSYDATQQVQHLSYVGVLSDADKAALTALSTSPVLPKLLAAVQAKAAEYALIKGHLPALQGALNLTAEEIALILADVGESLDDAPLSLPSVSLLYRYRVLASALKGEIREILALKRLSGIDPFAPLSPDPLTSIAEDHPFSRTLRFAEVAGQLAESGMAVADLDSLLRDEPGDSRQDPAGRLALLRTIAEGVRGIRTAHAVPADPGAMTDEALRQELGLALTPDVADRFVAMLNDTVETTVTKTGVTAADALDPEAFAGEPAIRSVRYNATRQEQSLTFRGVLTGAEKTALEARLPLPVPPNPHVPSAVFAALLDQVQESGRAFFGKHLQKQAPQPGGGFLDPADFDLLFGPASAGLTDAQLQARIRQQRTQLAQAFLPFLQRRLVRQFIVQTVTAYSEADAALAESLLADAALLAHQGATVVDVLAATAERGVTATFFVSTDGTGAPLAMATRADADTAAKPPGAGSARFEGYLEVPAPGAYRFSAVLGLKGASARLRFAHLPEPTFEGTATVDNDEIGDGAEEYAELAPGVLYRFTMELNNLGGGDGRMLVQGETLPRDRLAQLPLSPAAAIDEADRAVTALAKALTLLTALGIGEREARHVLTHLTDFDGVPLDKLAARETQPALEAARVTSLFAFALRLAGYAILKRDLGTDGADLVAVFEAGDHEVYRLLATLTRRDEATVRAAAHALSPSPSFASEKPLRRLWDALDVVAQFGVPAGAVAGWGRIVSRGASPAERHDVARDLKEAIKARFEPEAWQRVARPIYDSLRGRQRDALVAHVLHEQGFAFLEQLYEYFLIDPGMEPVVQTSRLRLAISSVQLFVQRCLLNLEPEVPPSAIINAGQWEWMKRYRVWEANRKIFLFPENWLEPETSLFAEIEGKLLTDDVSSELVEDAFLGYLRKLEELARLNVVAMHLETRDDDPANNVLHVVGRTYSSPYKHFYRRLAHGVWAAWEPITTEIQGDHLAPVMWRDRLCLFWVTFLDRADAPVPDTSTSGKRVGDLTTSEVAAFKASKTVDVQLHWSEYVQGEWTTHESSGLPVPVGSSQPFDPREVFVHVALQGGGEGVYVHLSNPAGKAFFLARRNSTPELVQAEPPPLNLYSVNKPSATQYQGTGPFKVTFSPRITTEKGNFVAPTATPSILRQGTAFTLLPCDNRIALGAEGFAANAANPAEVQQVIRRGLEEIAALMKPVFYQDAANTFYVEPSVSERTIEEWQEWVTTTPAKHNGDWLDPSWFKEIVLIPQIPVKNPVDPQITLQDDSRSRLTLKRRADWLVNPGTVLVYDGGLIGAGGHAGLDILPASDLGAKGGMTITVHPGSALAADESVVLTGAVKDGPQVAGRGLNIVGAGGFNSGLAQNYKAFYGTGNGAAFGR
jgi:ABC toxin N-terminal region/Neuraminidase-like domain/Salmonella virulence plasmid 28.1kDa A protein